jgi:hypothetical protein
VEVGTQMALDIFLKIIIVKFKVIKMTLPEYIQTEFGIVPDDVQLDQIREIVRGTDRLDIYSKLQKMNKFRNQLGFSNIPNPTMNNKNIFK